MPISQLQWRSRSWKSQSAQQPPNDSVRGRQQIFLGTPNLNRHLTKAKKATSHTAKLNQCCSLRRALQKTPSIPVPNKTRVKGSGVGDTVLLTGGCCPGIRVPPCSSREVSPAATTMLLSNVPPAPSPLLEVLPNARSLGSEPRDSRDLISARILSSPGRFHKCCQKQPPRIGKFQLPLCQKRRFPRR